MQGMRILLRSYSAIGYDRLTRNRTEILLYKVFILCVAVKLLKKRIGFGGRQVLKLHHVDICRLWEAANAALYQAAKSVYPNLYLHPKALKSVIHFQ